MVLSFVDPARMQGKVRLLLRQINKPRPLEMSARKYLVKQEYAR
jgi:hypothetical protein